MSLRPRYGYYGTIGPARGFTWAEVRCTDGSMPPPSARRQAVYVARNANELRRDIARKFRIPPSDVSIIVNSWYRSPAYNARIGGATNSMHKLGRAMDIRIRLRLRGGRRVTLHPRYVATLSARFVRAFQQGGIGWYDSSHGSFTHDDRGPGPRRWING